MPFKDLQIAVGPALPARAFQVVFPLIRRLEYSSPDVQFATKPIAKPEQITVPTRHGAVRILIYSPTAGDRGAKLAAGRRSPAHLITHGDGPAEVARAAITMIGDLLGKAKGGLEQNRK